MRKLIILCVGSGFLLFTACSKETELAKSVFIPDKDHPELPAYTEWGYNTFGAYFDREIFANNDNKVPAKVINTGGRTTITFKGQVGIDNYYSSYWSNSAYAAVSMTFDLPGISPQVYADLISLNNTTIDLTSLQSGVSITIDTITYACTVLNGSLIIKKAQNLIVDKKPVEVILSGVFEFQAIIRDEPVSITLGRFDVGIGNDNFFKY